MKKGPITPKGFRDLSGNLAKRRRKVIDTITKVLDESGFEPLETPIVEYAKTLKGKYGEAERLIYEFTDRGGRELALRYDLTVPLARFIANNLGVLNPTYSRYQIGEVFRGEKPQKGRYRQFTQFDLDIVGSDDIRKDAKIIATTIKSVRELGDSFGSIAMAINDRNFFKGLEEDVIRVWDKYDKVGNNGVIAELASGKRSKTDAEKIVSDLENKNPPKSYGSVKKILEKEYGLEESKDFFFSRYLARGLDYYTGVVFELMQQPKSGGLSLAGGGRYDNLMGIFAGRDIPAVGISFGIDRLTELV